MTSIIKPKAPLHCGPLITQIKFHAGWIETEGLPTSLSHGFESIGFYHHATGLKVFSAVEVADDGDGINKGPEYHISISKNGGRCSSAEAAWVLNQFQIEGAEEDNHVPNGIVRNFWRPVADNLVGIECKCKDEEPAIVEDKGDYIWRGVTK